MMGVLLFRRDFFPFLKVFALLFDKRSSELGVRVGKSIFGTRWLMILRFFFTIGQILDLFYPRFICFFHRNEGDVLAH